MLIVTEIQKYNNMKKSIIKFLILCCIIAILVYWSGLYMKYVLPDHVAYRPECTVSKFIEFVLLGTKEELIFRYLPFILATCIYVWIKKMGNKSAKISLFPLVIFIFIVQIVFSSLHVTWDPIYREIFYGLPPSPSFDELFKAFLLHGIAGIAFCISYFIYIPKDKSLSLLQLRSLFASSFVHILSNQLIIMN